jgi:methyl-accepting chemotaxis protein
MTTARPNAAPPEQPAKSGTSAELGGDRRSWKNFSLTSRHHYNYRGLHVLISFSLLALTSYTCAFCILCLHLGQEQAMAHLVLALTLVAGAALFWQARSKAHELAGVHLKLAQTLRRVSDGEKGVTLRFRSSDKLENLELAFDKMMLSLERQRGRA